MNLLEAIEKRHSVRRYTEQPIEAEKIRALESEVSRCNEEGGLHIQFVTDEPEGFTGILASYGHFTGVRNYFAMVGPKGPDLSEKLGYYGEQIVLKATTLGLDTCWVALTFSKGKSHYVVEKGEKLVCVISLGYGINHGVPHKSKPMESLYKVDGEMPDWFLRGMEAAILAPTATNQQKFRFTLVGDNQVKAEPTGGFYPKVDLGIVKCHFEIGAGKENFTWTT